MSKTARLFLCIALSAFLLPGCSHGEDDLSQLSLEELKTKARGEGRLYTVAMPDTWVNWGDTWKDLKKEYGILHQDLDMSSAEELELFRNQKKDGERDLGDVGKSYAIQAEKENLLLKYKTSYWDEIPSWAKDDDGDWIVSYTGAVSFLTNNLTVEEAPKSWKELRESSCKVTVGDVVSSVQAQYAVISSAYAFGGDIDNLQPAFDFWKEMAAKGRLDLSDTKPELIISGKASLAILMDFNSLNYKKLAQDQNPDASFTVTIPQDGSLELGYATIISRRAPHPHAAALAREYILSDKGQQNLAAGFSRPIRSVELPKEIREQMLPEDQYSRIIHIDDEAKLKAALQSVSEVWGSEILPAVTQ